MLKVILLSISLLATSTTVWAQKDGGSGSVGNGGEETELALWAHSGEVADIMQRFDFCEEFTEFSTVNEPWEKEALTTCDGALYQKLRRALLGKGKIKIQITTRTLTKKMNGVEEVRTALNFPARHLIVFNLARVQKMKSKKIREMLFHEFLGVVGSKLDLEYALSSRFAYLKSNRFLRGVN